MESLTSNKAIYQSYATPITQELIKDTLKAFDYFKNNYDYFKHIMYILKVYSIH